MPAKQAKTMKKQGKKKGSRGGGHLPCITAFPSTKRVLQTYSCSAALSEGAVAGGAAYFFRLNSVYDPDFTGAGGTATGYQTFSQAFYTYRVRRVTVRFNATATVGNGGFAEVVVAPTAYSVITSNPLYWRSIPFATRKQITPNVNGGHNLVSFTKTYDMAKVMRLTQQQFDNDMDYAADISTSPTRSVFLLVSVVGIGSASVATLTYAMDLTFDVEWSRPIPLSA